MDFEGDTGYEGLGDTYPSPSWTYDPPAPPGVPAFADVPMAPEGTGGQALLQMNVPAADPPAPVAMAPQPAYHLAPLAAPPVRAPMRAPPPPMLRPPPPFQGMGAAAAPRGGLGEPVSGSMLGLALLAVGVGAAIGATYGGLSGGIAGTLFGGAAVNALRAAKNVTQGSPDSDREALVSSTYAVAGAGAAIYLLYRAKASSKEPVL